MFQVGMENNTEGRSQAWILGHPGCFAYGTDSSAALAAVPQAIGEYREWISAHTTHSWLTGEDLVYDLVDTWDCYTIDHAYELAQEGYEVNAWFRHDWKPLSVLDISHGLSLLAWGREELLKITRDMDAATLEHTFPGERWSIAGILNHIGSAEWWYLDRLNLAFPRLELPGRPFERLQRVRSHLTEILPSLVDSTTVTGVDGEFWSPRKLLRRAVWHEYDHIAHIRKLI